MSPFVPPYPKPHRGPLSLLARLAFARRNVLALLRERNYRMKMGRFRIPGLDLVVVNEPVLARKILVDDWTRFPKGTLLRKTLDPVIRGSMFISNGEEWKRHRRMIDPAFEEKSLEELFPLMSSAVEAMLERLKRIDRAQAVDADIEMMHVTADVICRAICSVPFQRSDVAQLFGAFTQYQNAAPSFGLLRAFRLPPLLTPAGWRIRSAAKDIRRLVEAFVRDRFERVARGEHDRGSDILAALLVAEDPETGARFSFDELVEHLIVLFIAGHETTAAVLSWALYSIANCPHVQERLYAEATGVMGSRPPEFADIRRLKFTRDVLRETMRLYPPVGFIIREATEEAEFRGRKVCPGATVVVSPWLMQRHRELWERPDEFDPDRFGTASAKASLKQAYLPFSLGPRGCVGANFAMQEAVLIIAALVRAFRLLPYPEHVPEAASRLTLRSCNGIKIKLEPRGG